MGTVLAREENEAATITCPRCGLTSHSTNDVRQHFCGNCGIFLHDCAVFLCAAMNKDEMSTAERTLFLYVHRLPDGRYLGIEPDLNGGGFLKLCYEEGIDDVWQYDALANSINAAATWDPAKEREPYGWYRHPSSGRRRPFGNPLSEYIRE